MEKTKVTKRDNYNEIIKIATELGRVDLVDFANHEIELLDKKKSNPTKSKNAVENESFKEIIVETLKNLDKFVTITELQNANTELANLSNQRISALLTQLIKEELVTRKTEKKKAYFGI